MKRYVFDGHKLAYHADRLGEFMRKGDVFPLYMEISPVGRCNHRCLFCAYDFIGHPDRKLETARFLRVVDELAACGVRSLLYAGEGEPLLHPDIDRFVLHSKGKGIDCGIFTNGQLLSEKKCRAMLPALTFIRFSFNGGTPAEYARVHGVGPKVFDTVLENMGMLARLKKRGRADCDIGVQYVLIPENADHLIDAIRHVKARGADYFVIKPFVQQSCRQGYAMKNPFPSVVLERLFAEAERLSDARFSVVARRESFQEYGMRTYRHCYGTSFISTMNSKGDIATCLPYWDRKNFVFGNIYEQTFREIWRGAARRRLKARLEERLDVRRCPPNCRPHQINGFLWELRHPSVRHVNFI